MSDSLQPYIQSMEFSRPEHWTGEPFPSPGYLPIPGIKPRSPALQADSLPAEPQWKPNRLVCCDKGDFSVSSGDSLRKLLVAMKDKNCFAGLNIYWQDLLKSCVPSQLEADPASFKPLTMGHLEFLLLKEWSYHLTFKTGVNQCY